MPHGNSINKAQSTGAITNILLQDWCVQVLLFQITIFKPNKLDLDICKSKTVLHFRNLRNVYLFIDFQGMKAQVKRALKAILFFFQKQKINKKADSSAWKFLQRPIKVCGTLNSKTAPPYSVAPIVVYLL